MAEVWPDVTVEEGSLRFHIAGLRKALKRRQRRRAIHRHPGRPGLLFRRADLAVDGKANGRAAVPAPFQNASFLPARLARMVGRADGIFTLSAELTASRFVTIAGPGGVGKNHRRGGGRA